MSEEEFYKELPQLIESFWGENPPTYSISTQTTRHRAESGGGVDDLKSMWVMGCPGGFKWRKTWQEVFDDFHLAGEMKFWKEMNGD